MEYKGRAQEDERLVYGKNPVAELLKSGCQNPAAKVFDLQIHSENDNEWKNKNIIWVIIP